MTSEQLYKTHIFGGFRKGQFRINNENIPSAVPEPVEIMLAVDEAAPPL